MTICLGTTRPSGWRSLRSGLALLMVLTLASCRSVDTASLALLPASSPGSLVAGDVIGPAEIRAPATFVVDADSGQVLFEENAEAFRFPASLTKMMTLYLLFEAVGDGRLSLDSELLVTPLAALRPPTKVGVAAGSTIRVRDAAQSLAVKSANDVATVIAENIAGSEDAFAVRMNAKARTLGLRGTHFANASGLPDPAQVTTARDMALLARSLRVRFPQYAPYFAATEYSYGGKRFVATNKLLGKVPGVDGMKTGYIRDAGYHLVATAQRGGKRIIVVVMGGVTGRARDEQVTALIERYL